MANVFDGEDENDNAQLLRFLGYQVGEDPSGAPGAIDFRHHGSQVCKPIGSNQGLFEVVPVQGHRQLGSVEKNSKAIAVATDAHDDALFLGNARTADGAEWA